MRLIKTLREQMENGWRTSKSLTGVTAVMLAAFFACLAGLALDGRIVTGAPVWLKPAKFAISSALYAGTLAWLLRFLNVWPRLTRVLGATTSAVLVLEVGIIVIQAFRGTTSHFNVSSSLDASFWAIMGTAIGILWLASIGFAAALFRQRFADRGFGWAVRLGMLTTVLGSATGGLMVAPTEQQRVAIAQTHHAPLRVGAHTVGAPDGGPGLPGVGWSSNHGDLRIPHFLGLHALQVIPLLYFLRTRRRARFGVAETRFVFAISASYLVLDAILTWQALRGQSIVGPDANTGLALLIWAVGTCLAVLIPRKAGNGYRSVALRVV
jgi:hypothetical protein